MIYIFVKMGIKPLSNLDRISTRTAEFVLWGYIWIRPRLDFCCRRSIGLCDRFLSLVISNLWFCLWKDLWEKERDRKGNAPPSLTNIDTTTKCFYPLEPRPFVALPPRDHALICMATFGPFENSRPADRALLTALKVEWQNYHKPFPDMQLATARFLSQSP